MVACFRNWGPKVTITHEEIHAIVKRVVVRFTRKCWWAPADDLYQDGYVSALRATKSFDPNHGAEIGAYIERAVVFGIARALWRLSSPVSCGMNNPKKQLAGFRRVPVEVLCTQGDYTAESAEHAYERESWRHRANARMQKLSDNHGLENGAVEGILSNQSNPNTTRLRRRLAADKTTKALAQELGT